MVLTAKVYKAIQGTAPYVRPELPRLDVNQGDTLYIVAQKRHEYAEGFADL